MGAESTRQNLESHNFASGGLPVRLFYVNGGTDATHGYMLTLAASDPSDTVYAKGCMYLQVGAAADGQLHMNEGDGWGSSPSWVEIATP
jgi:hypothetical protein